MRCCTHLTSFTDFILWWATITRPRPRMRSGSCPLRRKTLGLMIKRKTKMSPINVKKLKVRKLATDLATYIMWEVPSVVKGTRESFISVDILLKATGNAPIMKKKKWAVDAEKQIGWIVEFVKKYLKLEPDEKLVSYTWTFLYLFIVSGKSGIDDSAGFVPVCVCEPDVCSVAWPAGTQPVPVLRCWRQARTALLPEPGLGLTAASTACACLGEYLPTDAERSKLNAFTYFTIYLRLVPDWLCSAQWSHSWGSTFLQT